MNLALPVVLALVALGLLVRRRRPGVAVAWVVSGLAATALLLPALALPGGVPSPSAILAAQPPWTGVGDPVDGNPHLLDVTYQVEPWLRFLRHELRAGRLPFWNPHQFSGEPFWSNGSSAVLFPLHLLFAALPLQLGLVLLPWLRLVAGGCGAWALARRLGVEPGPAAVAAVVYPLSGMVTSFLLFPMGNALALTPWVLWATEGLAAGTGTWRALAVVGGLQLLAGHPETPAFTALLAALYVAVRGAARPLRAWGGFAAGWGVAGAIAAVQLLPLAATVLDSSKWHDDQEPTPLSWGVRGSFLLRFVLPRVFGGAADGTWWGPFNDPATAVYAGLATLPLAACALPLAARDRRWAGIVALTAGAVLGAYHFPGAKELLLALPVVDRGLHHYLKAGAELGLALLAAAGWQRWLAGEGRRALAAGGVGLVAVLAVALAAFHGPWSARDLLAAQLPWLAGGVAVAVLLPAATLLPPGFRRRAAWAAPLLLAVDLAATHGVTNPGLPVADLHPRTPAVRFLAGRDGRLAAVGHVYRPDAAMVHGLHDVRGDSPVKLERYQRLYAALSEPHPLYFRPIRDWTHPALDRLGVRWVMTPPGAPRPVPGWALRFDGDDARVYERASALPLVRWADGDAGGIDVRERRPGRWRVGWRRASPALLVVAETWDPGWHAESDGRPIDVERVDDVLLGVRLPAGDGEVVLRYRPRGLVLGGVLTLAGVVAVAAPLPRRRGAPSRRPL